MYEILKPKEYEKVYIHNEIFDNLCSNPLFKSASNISFTYSYYCLVVYLFRYCKYAQGTDINTNTIKEILGYACNNKTLDFIIKKKGLLDQMQYTETIRDFPISHEMGDCGILTFKMYSNESEELRKMIIVPKNFKIKYPVKCFYRNIEDMNDNVLSGTFYDISNTHLFEVKTFIDIVGDKELGTMGFYLYQYLKHKCDLFRDYTASLERIISDTGISINTIIKYAKKLENRGYLEMIHNGKKIVDDKESQEMLPKTYKVKGKV